MKHMMIERRKYPRYNTAVEIFFKIQYDARIKVRFRVIEGAVNSKVSPKYAGLCKNVSAEGLLIVSKKRLAKGSFLSLEIYNPAIKTPVNMEGQVRWCKSFMGPGRDRGKYHMGIQIVSVNDKSVADSIYFDRKYMVVWSIVLESIFGTFAAIEKKRGKKN